MTDEHPHKPNQSAPPPTQDAIAVAVKQNAGSDDAPKVIAGGRGRIAEQILEIAFSQGIRVREDADLAQMLSVVDVESEIPLEAFATVAEILTYVYEANNAMKPNEKADAEESGRHRSSNDPTEMAEPWKGNEGKLDE